MFPLAYFVSRKLFDWWINFPSNKFDSLLLASYGPGGCVEEVVLFLRLPVFGSMWGKLQRLLIRVVPGEFVGVRIKAFPSPVLDVRRGTPQPCAQGKELVPHRERVRRRETGRKWSAVSLTCSCQLLSRDNGHVSTVLGCKDHMNYRLNEHHIGPLASLHAHKSLSD